MKKILVIDDDALNIEKIIQYLDNKDKYEILSAQNGNIACEIAYQSIPDLILLDWKMPEMSGEEVLTSLKNQQQTKKIPIIVMVGASSSNQDSALALEKGALDYIRKPINHNELIARVNSGLKISKLYQEIQENEEELNDLMGIVAHDLKSPLNKVLGLIQLLPLVGELNNEQKLYIEMVNKVIESGRKLIDDILIINEHESHFDTLNLEVFNVNDAILELINTHQNQTKQKNILIQFTSTVQDLEFISDKDAIIRVLDNLLSNALKFSFPDKSIFVSLKVEKDEVIISIKDEGQGISEEDQQKMFRKFQKLSAKPTGGENSTGLGLSIIKVLIEKLKGKITFESQVGLGTTFFVHLPLNIL